MGKCDATLRRVRGRTVLRVSFGLVIAGLIGGCASAGGADAPPPPEQRQAIDDPLEPINRGIFAFNQVFDRFLLRPAAIVWRDGVPVFFQERTRDLLNHVKTPVILANNLLQGDWAAADVTLSRFVVNTMIGLGGLIDVASDIGMTGRDEDFGQTLGTWSVGPGPYLMLPILGPSSVRDAGGRIVDLGLDPLTWYYSNPNNGAELIGLGQTAIDTVDRRMQVLPTTDELERSSMDYYVSVRSLYGQLRAAKIRNGRQEDSGGDGGIAFPGQAQ